MMFAAWSTREMLFVLNFDRRPSVSLPSTTTFAPPFVQDAGNQECVPTILLLAWSLYGSRCSSYLVCYLRCCVATLELVLDSDPAVKEILISMNEKDNFIIEDLDDYHLVIKADEEYRVRRELEIEVCICIAAML
jgi:TFIIH basal transcription factor complex TTD-A subunit